jgi:hypothetical protein
MTDSPAPLADPPQPEWSVAGQAPHRRRQWHLLLRVARRLAHLGRRPQIRRARPTSQLRAGHAGRRLTFPDFPQE